MDDELQDAGEKSHHPGFLRHLVENIPTLEEQKLIFAPEPYDPWAGENLSLWGIDDDAFEDDNK